MDLANGRRSRSFCVSSKKQQELKGQKVRRGSLLSPLLFVLKAEPIAIVFSHFLDRCIIAVASSSSVALCLRKFRLPPRQLSHVHHFERVSRILNTHASCQSPPVQSVGVLLSSSCRVLPS